MRRKGGRRSFSPLGCCFIFSIDLLPFCVSSRLLLRFVLTRVEAMFKDANFHVISIADFP
jgi:hypothetical protein